MEEWAAGRIKGVIAPPNLLVMYAYRKTPFSKKKESAAKVKTAFVKKHGAPQKISRGRPKSNTAL